MLSYLAFVHSGIESAGNPLIDGKNIAQGCLDQLHEIRDHEEFPPRLLILLASPAYLDSLKSEQLVNAVLDRFDAGRSQNTPLIGCSVAAVFFNHQIYQDGCLLVCLASRLLEAKVAVVPDASQKSAEAVDTLLKDLDLIDQNKERIHSFVERSLVTLLPGFGANKYAAPELHELLRKRLEARIPIFGGVSSANDPCRLRSGLLFANRNVYRDAIVAASLEHGTPFGFSLSQRLTDTHKTVTVTSLDSEDPRIIREFEGPVGEVMRDLQQVSPISLLGKLTIDGDPIVETPVLQDNGVRLVRAASERESFHVFHANSAEISKALTDDVKRSMNRAFLLNPIGALGLRCASFLRSEKDIGLDLTHDIRLVERDLAKRESRFEKSFVGGFVDGEAGLDPNGKSILSNWASATMVFGDELRFRTPVYRGFEKLTEFAGLAAAENQDKGIARLTQLIYDIGFPGSMISLCLFDEDRRAIVPHSASGPRYKRLLKKKKPYFINIDDIHQDDVLAIVTRTKRPQVVLDCRNEKCASMRTACQQGIISQYLVPLLNYDEQVTAILHIDLGDISYSKDLFDTERTALISLGNIVGAALNRIFIWEESKIIQILDQATKELPQEGTVQQALQHYFERVIGAFGEKDKVGPLGEERIEVGGHIRLVQQDHRLRLITGVGSYFEKARMFRREIDTDDPSFTGLAFRSEQPIIINSALTNPTHQKMRRQWKKRKPKLVEELGRTHSYVNIPFRSERDERGIISITASERWFFTDLHKKLLNVLSQRTAFLLETLRRKEQEKFLLAVSPSFSRVQNLENIYTTLSFELENFARAINAQIASLYILDEDRQRYILRAQYGWAKPEWLHAAYYESNDFWAGTTALTGTPRHIPDLNKYYNRYKISTRRHTGDAFGQELTAEASFEAIALGLRIADRRFGVVTFYRRLSAHADPGADSGFLLTNTELLQQGADNFASLVSILETARRDKWRKDEHKRRQDVHDVTVSAKISHPDQSEMPFVYRVCKQALISYHAVKVNFYKVTQHENEVNVELVQSTLRNTQHHHELGRSQAENTAELRLVNEAVMINRRGERRLLVERIKIKRDEERDPHRVALANLVSRAVIPLVSEKRVIGALDIHWSFEHMRKVDTANYQHGEAYLRMLGEIVGEAYAREEAKEEIDRAEKRAISNAAQGDTELRESTQRARDAVQATTAYLLQHHHQFRDFISQIQYLHEQFLKFPAKYDESARSLLDQLTSAIAESTATLDRMIEMGKKMIEPAPEWVSIWEIIDPQIKRSRAFYADYESRYAKCKVEVVTNWDESGGPFVRVDTRLINIAFGNLVDNAFKYLKDEGPRRIVIKAEKKTKGKSVVVTIEDTGKGMSDDMIRSIREEFYSIDGEIRLGIMISRLILGLHGGSVRHEPIVGSGTKTIITLPLDSEQDL